MAQSIDFATLKQGGLIKQRQPDFFCVRLRVPAGRITPEQLAKVGEAANRYGHGILHLTTRQGIEIPWVRLESFEPLKAELAPFGIIAAGCGPRVRNVMACPGSETCSHGLVDAQALAAELDARFFGLQLPIKKFKIAVAGCPNSCSTPQNNDLGLVGMVDPQLIADLCTGCELCVGSCREGALSMVDGLPQLYAEQCVNCGDCIATCPLDGWMAARTGFAVFVGGKIGRHPKLGEKIATFVTPSEALNIVTGIVDFVKAHGTPKERFGVLLDRVGLEKITEFVGVGV